jgi:hypothetical protein
MDHAQEFPGAGRVDAVVVLWAEVQRGEMAICELRGKRGIATDQGGGAVAVALGLEDLIALDRPEPIRSPRAASRRASRRG